jgi:hypothetical protein
VKLATHAELPGGAIVHFGTMAYNEATGRGKTTQEAIGSGLEGAATGALFKGSGSVGEAFGNIRPVFNPIARIASIAGGTMVQTQAEGSSLTDSVRSVVYMV